MTSQKDLLFETKGSFYELFEIIHRLYGVQVPNPQGTQINCRLCHVPQGNSRSSHRDDCMVKHAIDRGLKAIEELEHLGKCGKEERNQLREALQNMTGLFGEAVTRHIMGKAFGELHQAAVKGAKEVLEKYEEEQKEDRKMNAEIEAKHQRGMVAPP